MKAAEGPIDMDKVWYENSWRNYAPIDWSRLGRAYDFFKKKGYHYLEVPWVVSQDIVDATMPERSVPIVLEKPDSFLVGSAEQGFLELWQNYGSRNYAQKGRFVEGELWFSISPCFRGEFRVNPGWTQLAFMKLELFAPRTCYESVGRYVVEDAAQFMMTEGAYVNEIKTELGFDLVCEGIEVGSYGKRTYGDLSWFYGTGLAEPRFSTALELQKKTRRGLVSCP